MDLTAADILTLRLWIADPAANTGADHLTDEQLEAIAARHDTLEGIAAEGWAIKAGVYADEYEANIDGAYLSRQRKFEHALKMLEYYESVSGESVGSMTNIELIGPTVGAETDASEMA